MLTNLPIDFLRTFVAIADSGSISRAAAHVFRSQSALSLQMKRLEELTQTPLFRREGRHLALTKAGMTLLTYAREILRVNDRAIAVLSDGTSDGPIRVGILQDFAETLLPSVLKKFTLLHPDIHVQVLVRNSHELNELLKNDMVDVALSLSSPDNRSVVVTDDLLWLGDPALLRERFIPLAVLDSPCICRDAAITALTTAGLEYRVVVEAPNSAVLAGVVNSGLAITYRPRAYAASAMVPMQLSCYPLSQVGYTLQTNAPRSVYVSKIYKMIKAALTSLPSLGRAQLAMHNPVGAASHAGDERTKMRH